MMANTIPQETIDAWFETAQEAARSGGACLREGWGGDLEISFRSANDLTTQVDLKSQRVILETILKRYPDHSVLSEEEGGKVERGGAVRWIVDPLDGTTNFAHGFPFVAVSIAVEVEGSILLGIVYNPVMEEFFSARAGGGAFCNGRPMKVSTLQPVQRSLLCTGFPYELESKIDLLMGRFQRMLSSSQGVRRPGSAALDLCYVAKGIFEGFWEQGLKPWDVAAGALIVGEAGGKVSNFSGAPFDVEAREILATNGLIHDEMTQLLKM